MIWTAHGAVQRFFACQSVPYYVLVCACDRVWMTDEERALKLWLLWQFYVTAASAARRARAMMVREGDSPKPEDGKTEASVIQRFS